MLKNIGNNTKRHTKFGLNNTVIKIINACIKSTNKSINESIKHLSYSRIKLYKPTISKQIKGSYIDIAIFLKNTLYNIYLLFTKPKIIGKKEKKEEMLKKFRKNIRELVEKEKNETVKRVTALLNLTLLDYLKIFLDYGYKNKDGNIRTKKEIKIDENKYGIKTIKLENFETYKEIKEKFSLDKDEQNYYRGCLRNLLRVI